MRTFTGPERRPAGSGQDKNGSAKVRQCRPDTRPATPPDGRHIRRGAAPDTSEQERNETSRSGRTARHGNTRTRQWTAATGDGRLYGRPAERSTGAPRRRNGMDNLPGTPQRHRGGRAQEGCRHRPDERRTPDNECLRLAETEGVALLATLLSPFEASGRIYELLR